MISERLGHSSIAGAGDIYAVVEEERQREVSERLVKTVRKWEKVMLLQRSRSTRILKPWAEDYGKMENVSSHTIYKISRNGVVLNSVLNYIAGY